MAALLTGEMRVKQEEQMVDEKQRYFALNNIHEILSFAFLQGHEEYFQFISHPAHKVRDLFLGVQTN